MNDQSHPVPASATTPVEDPRRLLSDIGELVDEAPDTMALHTREAYRLFVGRGITYLCNNGPGERLDRVYDERAYLELDPRVELAAEPGYAFWEARQFDKSPRHKVFLADSATNGIESGVVVGLCTRDPPSYAMLGFNRAAPNLDRWSAEQRLLIAAQASMLGKILSRTVRRFLNEQELLFPAPLMRLNLRERESYPRRLWEDVEGDRGGDRRRQNHG